MSMATLERSILWGAQTVLQNAKLRRKDITEWSTSKVKPSAGEIVVHVPNPGVYVAVKKECDKRRRSDRTDAT